MKKLSTSLLLAIALGLSITSCSSDKSFDDGIDVTDPTAESGKLQFEIDGKTFVSTAVQAIVNDNFVSITGLRSPNGDFVQLTIPSNKVGTYTWKNASTSIPMLAFAYIPSSNEYSSFIAKSPEDALEEFGVSDYKDTANITITAIDQKTKKISGTFQFTGLRYTSNNKTETKVITKGSFNDISFKDNAPPIANNNTLTAKLDGATFDVTNVIAKSSLGKIFINGENGVGENISISFPSTIKAGNYKTSDYNYINYTKDSTNNGGFFGNGTITILSHDTAKKKISGKFTASFKSFFVTTTHEASEGTFNVTY
ncbi:MULTISPECIES: DUF6252 family protein [unclassified Flavobacterium]|uniref:DUF6252 family protein n=1 Tax=unclassified Flavobacterium TaxID=196869 RepID=UPI000580385E|nr:MULTISPECIES: DUF6252 family protein [unclassified Flavobacterium]KIA94975.1 hypothetical protein OA93_18655 [Flavobacterium sp. KMS]OUL61505.1 hypothetical protein B8T70_14950 [Flavobacterium sp. AJR]